MENLIALNINRIIDQLCAANCTNGQLTAEVECLTAKNEELQKEITALRDELSGLKELLDTTDGAYRWQCKETDRYKALYESLTKVAE